MPALSHVNTMDMIYTTFILAFRRLRTHKTFAVSSIFTLSLGITCTLLMLLWVRDEMRIDQFHAKRSKLYRVITRGYPGEGKVQAYPYTQGLLYGELKNTIPEVEYACAFSWETKTVLRVGNQFHLETGRFASEDFFSMFTFPLLVGDPSSSLTAPTSIAISENMAKKYFGSTSAAMGKTIRVDNQKDFQVEAIFETVPEHSSLQFDYVLPWSYFVELNPWLKDWKNTEPHTYVCLRPESNLTRVNTKLKHFLDSYELPLKNELFLQPFPQAYLYSNFSEGKQDGGRIEYVRMFSVIALSILLIACINFTNLSTAQALKRAKEVGVRKVMGAGRWLLMGQFMGEAFLFSTLALICSCICSILLLPFFNELTGKQISFSYFDFSTLVWVIALCIGTALLAGAYPALYLSSFTPVGVLKGIFTFNPRAKIFWQALVTTQYTLAILIFTGSIVCYKQIEFIQNKNLGYDRENLIYIPMEGELASKYTLFKQSLLQATGVQWVTRMGQTPTSLSNSTLDVSWPKKDPTVSVDFMQVPVGYDFLKTLDIKLLQGREFSKDFADSTGFLVNETALRIMGIDKDPLGEQVTFLGKKGTIIGVVQDFHLNSLHEQIPPLLIHLDEQNPYWGNVLVRLQRGKAREVLPHIERLHGQLNPNVPLSYKFSSEAYSRLYKSEQITGTLTGYLAVVAILISCMGLFGLATFTTGRRRKEIAVRKVVGASIGTIVLLLVKDFIKLVLIASVIAIPIALLAISKWMENFAYQIEITPAIFFLSTTMALLMALLTVAFKTIKAALANPIKSLQE